MGCAPDWYTQRRRVQAVPAHERVLSILEDAPVELKEERCPSTS